MPKVRRPTVAGTFYEAKPEELKGQIEGCFLHELGPGSLPIVMGSPINNLIGVLCPHAGYMYSGPVAAHSYSKLASCGKPDTVVLFGPNHTGMGSGLAAAEDGFWKTPLGEIEVDSAIIKDIALFSGIVDFDDSAHASEHSIEVQLPFLQYLYGSSFKIVPISFLMQDLASSVEVGKATAKALKGKNSVIIASSDMSHYEPREQANRKDKLVIDSFEALDEERLYNVIASNNISACGYGPIAALIAASKQMGAREAKLLCYETSGGVTGDYSAVVGYAAAAFMK
jgi:AmmeMemoRadiSam system protein B